MQDDLKELLDSWPYDADESSNNYRLIQGADGRTILQVREPLGIQQMEYDGRPDGQRPQGCATWLDYYEELARDKSFFQLTHDDSQRLMQEGILFYQRYLILYQMCDWSGVARDTGRNLRYFDFMKRCARHREDSLMVEQYRPYVARMNAVARAQILFEAGNIEGAIAVLRNAILGLESLEPIPTQVFKLEHERSIKHLKELLAEFEAKRPEGKLDALRRKQKEAILGEDFERAAQIRDAIRALEGEFKSAN